MLQSEAYLRIPLAFIVTLYLYFHGVVRHAPDVRENRNP